MRVFALSGYAIFLIVALTNPLIAGPPPYPEDLAEPNILSPRMTIGGYGNEIGQFNEPHGIDFAKDGRVAIVDKHNNRVCILDRSYTVTHCVSDSTNPLNAPTHAIWIGTDRLAVSDTGNGRVVVMTDNGKVIAETGPGLLHEPTGISLLDGKVYVADRAGQKIGIFDRSLSYISSFGEPGNGQGQFIDPSSITTDGVKHIFVADSYNNRIQVFGGEGKFENEFGDWGSFTGLLANPSSVHYSNGLVFVTDLINHRIQVFNENGDYAMQWGRHPVINHEGEGRLHYPSQIAVAPDGEEAIVCEPVEHRCQIFDILSATKLVKVDDQAWWDKNGRFHYGARPSITPDVLAISEPDTHSVLIFDVSTDDVRFVGRVGGQGRAIGSLVKPSGVAINAETNTLYVSDSGNFRLASFDLTGPLSEREKAVKTEPQKLIRTVSTVDMVVADRDQREKGAEIAAFKRIGNATEAAPVEPSALVFTRSGFVLMADPINGRILELDKELNVTRILVENVGDRLPKFRPNDIALSPDERRIYVVDFYNSRIAIFDRDGRYLSNFGSHGSGDGEFVHAFGVGVGPDGSVYVSDEAVNRVSRFDPDGKFLMSWGSWGAAPGQFYKPKGLAIDRDKGRIVLADFGNHRAQIFDLDGNFVSTFGIGQGYVPFNLAQPTGFKATSEGGSAPSNGGNFVVNYRLSESELRPNEPYTMDYSVLDYAGQPIARTIRVKVSAMMPAHYHGLALAPEIESTRTGWQARDIRFQMPGHWQIYFDIDNGIVTERAQIDVMVR